MSTPEKEVQDAVYKAVGQLSWARIWRQNTGKLRSPDGKRWVAFGIKGAADLSGLIDNGVRIEIECKAPGGKQTPDQERFEEMIRNFGGIYLVAYDAMDTVRTLRRIRNILRA